MELQKKEDEDRVSSIDWNTDRMARHGCTSASAHSPTQRRFWQSAMPGIERDHCIAWVILSENAFS